MPRSEGEKGEQKSGVAAALLLPLFPLPARRRSPPQRIFFWYFFFCEVVI